MNDGKDTFLCIASGPSLTKEDVDYTHGKDLTTIVVNDNYKICPWAEHLYAADTDWYKHHLPLLKKSEFKGKMWMPRNQDFAQKNGINYIECIYKSGLGMNGKLHCGHNSGYQAINLAAHLGADKILLLGYDMGHSKNGKVHWFGNHPAGLRNQSNYEKWIKHFDDLAKDLDKLEIEVVNCTRTSKIEVFKKSTISWEI